MPTLAIVLATPAMGDLKPVDYEDVTVTGTPRGLTASKTPSTACLVMRAEGGPIRYTVHVGGTPVAGGSGFLLFDGDEKAFSGREAKNFSAVRDGVTNGTLRVTYYQIG